MRYLRFFSVVVALLIFSVAAAEEKAAPAPEPVDLSEAVNKLDELFQLKGKSINKRFPQLLWRGTEQKTLYCPDAEMKKFRYGDESVYGFQIAVADQQIKSLKITIFTRGDAGKIEKEELKAKLRIHSAALAELAKGRRDRTLARLNKMRISRERFIGENVTAELEFVYGPNEQPERISLVFQRPGTAGERFRKSVKTEKKAASLIRNIIHKNGEHYILLPMVDQGSKGYCVPATVSRVLLYYGSDIDMHAVARLLNANPQSGTNVQRTVNTLRDMVTQLRVRFSERYQFDVMRDSRDYASFARRYNRIAKKQKLEPIPVRRPRGMPEFDYGIFKQLRNHRPIRDFYQYVKSCIDRGIPVCWSIMVFPKDKAAGGDGNKIASHMRLITGYTDRGDIIYSDSWGKGHEKKKISQADAIAITKRLFTIEPRR